MWMKWQLCCLVQVWAEGTKVWDIVHKTKRFNRKKLHVQPRTVGITANYAQYIILIGLCRVCWLLVWSLSGLSERVSYSDCYRLQDTGFGPNRDMRFFSSLKCPDRLCDHPASYSKGMGILPWGQSALGMELTTLFHLVAKVKNEWRCTSAPPPPLCLHGMDKTTFLNTGFHRGKL